MRGRMFSRYGSGAPVAAFVAACGAAAPAVAQLQPIVGPPVRIDAGGTAAANETTAAATSSNPNAIVAGWNDWRDSGASEVIRTGFSISIDGGLTWQDTLLRPPAGFQTGVEGDPMTAWDDRTGTLFAGGIAFSGGGLYVARKRPGESDFDPAVVARPGSGIDKCWMAAGPLPGVPDSTRVYVGYNQGLIHSDDLGDTWTAPSPLASGIGFLPRVGPDGAIHIAYWDFSFGMRVLSSTDGGDTFDDRLAAERLDVWGTQDGSRAPGTFRIPPLGSLAVNPIDGSLAMMYFDTTQVAGGQFDLDLYFVRSVDGGANWSDPVVVLDDGADEPFADQLFPWIEYDRFGRLHVLYYDTVNDVRPDGSENGQFDAYHAWSLDDGATWRARRLSPQSFNASDDGLDRNQQFLGDYLGMAVAGDAAFPVYLDTAAGDPDIITHRIELPIPGDTGGDGSVGFDDILAVLAAWGPCPPPGPCAADVDGDGSIGLDDLLFVLVRFGL